MAKTSQRDKLLEAAAQAGPLQLTCDQPVTFTAAKGEGEERKLAAASMLVYSGGKMMPSGFTIPVVADLKRTTVAAGQRPFLLHHDPTRIVGHGDVTVEPKAIRAEGVISGTGTAAQEVQSSSANGFPWKSSMGSSVGKLEFIDAGKQVEVNGSKFNGPLYVARDVVVHEVSFVPIAGDNRTSARVAASLSQGVLTMEFTAWLAAKGIEAATLTEPLQATLQAAFDAEQNPPAPKNGETKVVGSGDTTIADFRAEQAAEVSRVKGIRKVLAEYPGVTFKAAGADVDLEAHAIAEGWTAEKAELTAMRAARPAPAIHSKNHDATATMQAMQGAVMLRAGLALDAKHWGTYAAAAAGVPDWLRAGLNDSNRNRIMDASHQFAGLAFVDFCREACRLDGKDAPINRTDMIRAAFSGGSMTNIFSTSVNARLLATYLEAGDSTLGWTSETDVSDFKTNERAQLAKGAKLEKLPRGQTAGHVNRSDKAESYKIYRYARQFVVDEQDVIDNNMDAFRDMPNEMGLAAARIRPDLVYSILFANAALADGIALFHADHHNTDTSAALAADKLKAGITAIGVQTDNGVNLNLEASHLITPKVLGWTSKELVNSSMIVVAGTAGSVTERGNANTLAAAVTPVQDSRLDNGVVDPVTGTSYSGDANDWFLAAAGAHTIEVAYLAGTGRVPQVRSFVLDKGQWGMGWDIKHDVGAKALDFKGLYRGQG